MKKTILFNAVLLICNLAFGQNVKENSVKYFYTQLPLQPLETTVKTFSVEVKTPYPANDASFKERAYKDYQSDSLNYPHAVADAKKEYDEKVASYDNDL